MKAIRFTLFFSLLVFVSACMEDSDSPNIAVDQYVSLLKKGNYEESNLPEFTSTDISRLLTYRNDRQVIKDFPRNWISSYWNEECTLGMYVLWTIESIRARSIGSDKLTGTFPSQNPVVENSETFEILEQSNSVQKVVADSYFEWWEANKAWDFQKFHQIDPLADTDYRWH
ncbi:DUF4943 family protein [Algoriphagus aestuarii]|nr:DUF4943 family protein [Algoriphagus aestuarii]